MPWSSWIAPAGIAPRLSRYPTTSAWPSCHPTGLIWAVCVDGIFDTIRRYGMPARNGSLCSGRLMRCWLGIMLLVRDLTSPLLSISRLEVAAGECVAIRGASGAGKSLLLRSIADLDPNEGEVSLDDRSRRAISACRWRREVMLVPAEAGWWADTVRDHFLAKQPASELIASLGLPSEALEWNVARLSTGERHRLAIARALSFSPRAMLLDEPTAALDAMAAERLEVVLRKRLAEGMHLLLVTHDKDQAARMAARTVIMANGRIAEVTGPSA